MSSRKAVSGFPEWTPSQRQVEVRVLDICREVFELHGFSNLETRSVEPVEVLLRKGDIDKEVYGVHRLADDSTREAELALHFDLTVPFARYVGDNAGKLVFPFARYQIQKVWRGERPQEGRYREFTQADIDIVNPGELAFHHEVDMPLVMAQVFDRLHQIGFPRATISVNNRKLAEGFYRGLGLENPADVLRCVDKLDKIGPRKVEELLVDIAGANQDQAQACLALADIRTSDASFVERVRALGVEHELLEQGIGELANVMEAAHQRMPGAMVADLRIARGLDYYTSTVFETFWEGFEDKGSISSGGRYDSLAHDGKTTYPGVGISFGVTRALGLAFGAGLNADRSVTACVMVAVNNDTSRETSAAIAHQLRQRGIATLVAPKAAKFGKQIKHADRLGVPFVWFPGEDGEPDTVKDIRTGEQIQSDAATWQPPQTDVQPAVVWSA